MSFIGEFLEGVEAAQPYSGGSKIYPAGDYTVMLTSADLVQAKSGNDMIAAVFTILEGEYNNEKIYENFVVGHPTVATRERFKSKLKALAAGCGFPNAQDSSELLNTPLGLKLTVYKKDGKDQQGIDEYVRIDPRGGQRQPAATPITRAAPSAAAPARTAAAGAPPWVK